MPGLMDNLSTLNSFLRTLIAIAVIGGAGVAGYVGYTTFNAADLDKQRREQQLAEATKAVADFKNRLGEAEADIAAKTEQIRAKDEEITALNQAVEKLKTSIGLLKVDHRVARLTAVDQGKDEATGELTTLVEFVELNDEGHPLDTPHQFRIRGDTVFLDNWVVKFDDKYVENADLERGTSLVLFRRIFGEMQQPVDGFPLDEVGSAPKAYQRGGRMSEFEKKIWGDFWAIANDPARAEKLGIRAAHGLAVSMKVQKGKSYTVQLRASDGLSFVPDEAAPKSDEKPPPTDN
jgi:hypothetical protein